MIRLQDVFGCRIQRRKFGEYGGKNAKDCADIVDIKTARIKGEQTILKTHKLPFGPGGHTAIDNGCRFAAAFIKAQGCHHLRGTLTKSHVDVATLGFDNTDNGSANNRNGFRCGEDKIALADQIIGGVNIKSLTGVNRDLVVPVLAKPEKQGRDDKFGACLFTQKRQASATAQGFREPFGRLYGRRQRKKVMGGEIQLKATGAGFQCEVSIRHGISLRRIVPNYAEKMLTADCSG